MIKCQLLDNYCILPNKRACLNKRTPDFLFWLVISEKFLIQSESSFQHLTLTYSMVHTASFIQSDKGEGLFSVSAPSAFIRQNTVVLQKNGKYLYVSFSKDPRPTALKYQLSSYYS